MEPKTAAYLRARIALIEEFLSKVHNNGEKNNAYVLLRNGLIPAKLLKGKSEETVVTQWMKGGDYSDAPLSFSELCRWNTWFIMHPEKVAGTEIVTTSFEFPITIKGNQQDIIRVLTPDIGKSTTTKQPWEMTSKELINTTIADMELFGDQGVTHWFRDNHVDKIVCSSRSGNGYKGYKLYKVTPALLKKEGKTAHYNLVKKALSKGKSIPEKVLKEYPELRNNQIRIRKAKIKAMTKLKLLELMKV